MSAGRILTLGLGTPFSDAGFLVTLGYGTAGVVVQPQVRRVHGGWRMLPQEREEIERLEEKLAEITQQQEAAPQSPQTSDGTERDESPAEAVQLPRLGDEAIKAIEASARDAYLKELARLKAKRKRQKAALMLLLS